MISLQGLSALTGLALVDATRDRQINSIRNSAQGSREINSFRERIGNIQTVDQLLDDRELYSFVMKAYDLEDQIFGKALMAKVLKSDINDSTSLVNRLTSQRFKDIHQGLGFAANGIGNTNTLNPAWQEAMVERFLERQFINIQTDQNETIGTVLEFRKQAGSISSPYDFLKSTVLSEFIRTAIGIPSEAAGLNIDKLAALITDRVDIQNLNDPKVVNKLVLRYIAIKDAQNSANVSANAAVQLMSAAVNTSSGGQFVPITINIESIFAARRGAYS
ncbi:MAG: DUF1217 domain-containing protein [Amylibacter sp.]|nr:DUF1217 domain-containing protein [Amylibacter sp.]